MVGSLTTNLPSTIASKSRGVGLSLERHMSLIDSRFLISALKTYACHQMGPTTPRNSTYLVEDGLSGILGRLWGTQCVANSLVRQRFFSQCGNLLRCVTSVGTMTRSDETLIVSPCFSASSNSVPPSSSSPTSNRGSFRILRICMDRLNAHVWVKSASCLCCHLGCGQG